MPQARSKARTAAVIDIGSNSIRMVLFRLDGEAVWTSFNEKAAAGLGRSMARTGRLDPQGVETAYAALARFRALIEAARPDEVIVAATAAVRQAEDGPDFVKAVAARTGFKVRVLSGAEEARLSATGVFAGIPGAAGLVADLGGLSLELVPVGPDGPRPGESYPLGPFAVGAETAETGRDMRAEVRERLKHAPISLSRPTLYVVGGVWRSLASLSMQSQGYPLPQLHRYEMEAGEARALCQAVARKSPTQLARMPGVSRRRAATLPYAGLLLDALIKRFRFETITVSGWGLREGLLFEARTEARRKAASDMILGHGLAALWGEVDAVRPLAEAVSRFVAPIMAPLEPVFSPERDPELVRAACWMAEAGQRFEPGRQAEPALHAVLRGPVTGADHIERAFLAAVAFARRSTADVGAASPTLDAMLSLAGQKRAQALGTAIRLACDIAAGQPGLLDTVTAYVGEDRLHLSARDPRLLQGERIPARAVDLARMVGVELNLAV